MELGGNAPFIVFDDADLDAAVQGAHREQVPQHRPNLRCANRLLVQAGVYDAFTQSSRPRSAKLRVGDGLGGGHRPGSADRREGARQGRGAHRRRRLEGREVAAGGKRHALGGTFFEPTILTERDPADARGARGDLRPGRAAVQIQDRGRGDRHGQRHRVRPRGLFIYARSRAAGASRRPSNTASSASTPASSRPKWRRSAASRNRERPRGIEVRHLDYTEIKYVCVGGVS
jgi:succinate-semialdehyde dehydrogenase / glutarate-semialdehyde dehydrogenase